jgi:hypothetical protein
VASTPTKLVRVGKPGIRIVLNELILSTAQKFEEAGVAELPRDGNPSSERREVPVSMLLGRAILYGIAG